MEKALEFFKKNYKLTNFLIKNVAFAFLILIILHFSNFFDINLVLRFRYVVLIVLGFLTFLLFLFFEKDKEEKKKKYEPFLKIFFLVGLVTITIGSLDYQTLRNFEVFNALITLIPLLQNYVIAFTIISGFFTFYFNSERIEEEVEKEKSDEEKKEKERAEEFEKKFGKINKIPILRNVVKWMYKEGWWYSIGLGVVILIAICLYFYGLGNYGFQMDEFYHAGVVKTYAEEGKLFYINDGVYNRSKITSLVSVFSHEIFDSLSSSKTEEFVSRSPIALIGLLNILLVYALAKTFASKKLAILVTSFFAFETYIMYFATYFRFYTISIFFILLFLFLSIKYYKNSLLPIFFATVSLFLYRYLSEYFLFLVCFYILVFIIKSFSCLEEIKFKSLKNKLLIFFIILIFGVIIYSIIQIIVGRINSDTTYNLITWSFNSHNIKAMSNWLILNYGILLIPATSITLCVLIKSNFYTKGQKLLPYAFLLLNLMFLFLYIVNIPFNFTFRVTLFFLPIIFIIGFKSLYYLFIPKKMIIFLLTGLIIINLFLSIKYHINEEGDLYHPTKLPYEKIEVVTDNKGMAMFIEEYLHENGIKPKDVVIGYIGLAPNHLVYYIDESLTKNVSGDFRNKARGNSTVFDLKKYLHNNRDKYIFIIINANAKPRLNNKINPNVSEANIELKNFIVSSKEFRKIHTAKDYESDIYIKTTLPSN